MSILHQSAARRAITALRLPRRARPIPSSPVPSNARRLTRIVAEQLLSRASGAAAVDGNAIDLLRDGTQNYPAWLDAIAAAQHSVDFENYIVRDDDTGRQFAAALMERARAGVLVRVLYDWLGCIGTPRRFWQDLRNAGAEVLCFNPFRLDSPLGWISRNHRKTLRCDDTGFVAGLCVGDAWTGTPIQQAWRDTGIRLRGPAVHDLAAAFAHSWARAGGEVRPGDLTTPGVAGDIAVRVINSRPNTMGLYRFDQLVAGIARETLWLTDAYFVGTTAYVQALCDAARDSVDVRLLVPGSSDIPVAQALSRAGYRPLLEAGCRVFEWNGPMLHAKTAVADGRWARIGSTNLNIASWMGNWELDVAIEDEGFASQLAAMFERDLQDATEIVIEPGTKGILGGGKIGAPDRPRDGLPLRRGSPGRLTAGAVGLSSTVTAAITNHRALGPAEARVTAAGGVALLVLAAIAMLTPRLIAFPLGVLAAWFAGTLLVRAWRLRRSC